jgi:hypothetical protein
MRNGKQLNGVLKMNHSSVESSSKIKYVYMINKNLKEIFSKIKNGGGFGAYLIRGMER